MKPQIVDGFFAVVDASRPILLKKLVCPNKSLELGLVSYNMLDDREKQNEIRIWPKEKQGYGYHD
ncbi:hypothetical protein RND71_042854 [Anisodus tanguticus]|uniref:Uncharacterized protein n=1 Tax=Anisodus tanguticus TaxID=243964 RepID=A0AAE1QUE9_9SOLA|nr:hypothetical protein RND71_042854 [Anisodus tanguticus]